MPQRSRRISGRLKVTARERTGVALATVVSSVPGLVMVGGAVYWLLRPAADNGAAEPVDSLYASKELARHDDKDGDQCLMAVDGETYLMDHHLSHPVTTDAQQEEKCSITGSSE